MEVTYYFLHSYFLKVIETDWERGKDVTKVMKVEQRERGLGLGPRRVLEATSLYKLRLIWLTNEYHLSEMKRNDGKQIVWLLHHQLLSHASATMNEPFVVCSKCCWSKIWRCCDHGKTCFSECQWHPPKELFVLPRSFRYNDHLSRKNITYSP